MSPPRQKPIFPCTRGKPIVINNAQECLQGVSNWQGYVDQCSFRDEQKVSGSSSRKTFFPSAPSVPMVDTILQNSKNGLFMKSRYPHYPTPFPCRCCRHRRSLHGADSEGHGLLPRAPYHLCPEQPHQQGRVHGWEVLPGHRGQRGVVPSPSWEDIVTITMWAMKVKKFPSSWTN